MTAVHPDVPARAHAVMRAAVPARMNRSVVRTLAACFAVLLLTCPAAPAAASDGQWLQLGPYGSLTGHGSVYDAADRRVIVVAPSAEVFEYPLDGPRVWRALVTQGPQPPAMTAPAVAFDAARRHVYVVGATATYRLNLNGTPTWSQIATAHFVTGITGLVAVVDPVRDRLVVHGGSISPTCGFERMAVWAMDLAAPSGWTLLQPSGPARQHHAAIVDPANDRMVVFGGRSSLGCTLYTDTWAFDLAGNVWSQMLVSGTPPAGRELHTAVFDEARNRMLIHGGVNRSDLAALTLGPTPTWSVVTQGGDLPGERWEHAAIIDPVTDELVITGGKTAPANPTLFIHHFDLAGETWDAPSLVAARPADRTEAVAVFDPTRNRLVLHGGVQTTNSLSDVWVRPLDASDVWTQLATASHPFGGRSRHAAIYDPPRDRLLIFGGQNQTSDLWELPFSGPAALTWAHVTPLGLPLRGRSGHTAIYDPEADRMITFGGLQYAHLNDTWSFALATSTWSQLFPGGTWPMRRSDHAAVYDPVRHRMIVLGGQLDGPAGPYTNEVWALDLTAMAWSQLSPAGSAPPGRAEHIAVYDRARDRIVMHGGRNSSSGPALSDTWALSLSGTPTWAQLVPGGVQRQRSAAVGVFDALRDRLIVATGTTGSQRLDETWQLAWTMPTSVEPAPRPPLAPGAIRLSPNPSHAGVSIEFALATRGPARVGVVDLAGRRVAELREGEFDVGTHALRWDGRDIGGARVAPGIYFVIVESGGERRVSRFVLTQ